MIFFALHGNLNSVLIRRLGSDSVSHRSGHDKKINTKLRIFAFYNIQLLFNYQMRESLPQGTDGIRDALPKLVLLVNSKCVSTDHTYERLVFLS